MHHYFHALLIFVVIIFKQHCFPAAVFMRFHAFFLTRFHVFLCIFMHCCLHAFSFIAILCIFMHFHGLLLCIFVDFDSFSWILIHFHAFLCIFTHFCLYALSSSRNFPHVVVSPAISFHASSLRCIFSMRCCGFSAPSSPQQGAVAGGGRLRAAWVC